MSQDEATQIDRHRLLEMLRLIGQEHLLDFWDQLGAAGQHQLAAQIEQIDPELFRDLQKEFQQQQGNQDHWSELAAQAVPPPAMRLDGSGVQFSRQAARAQGEEILRDGQVGMILVAGGLGTRLGFDQPKGLLPLAPLSNRTLFQILLENLLAIRRRYGVSIPLFVMTSPSTDQVTREYLNNEGWFGLPPEDCHIFCQATMWAVDDRFERILLESPASLFLGPDGHGGMLSAFAKSGCLADAQRRGLRHLFYGQIDNPLLQVCDELFLGSHVLAKSDMTTQVVPKRHPLERVGNVVSIDGKVQVIEYSDLTEEYAKQTNPDGGLKLWAGSLAVHAFSLDFLSRSAADKRALPFHFARKTVSCLNPRQESTEPVSTKAIRFERFIFDLLPNAKNALVVEADAAEAFAPVKNSDDEATDNARLAKAAMMAQARRHLRAAGIHIADDVPVEINPLWASTVQEIQKRLPAGTIIREPKYFAAPNDSDP